MKNSTPQRKKLIPGLFYMHLVQLDRVTRRWLWHQKIQTYSCFAFKCFILASMYVKCRTQTRTRYVSISGVVAAVRGELSKCLIGMHAFTDCDTVSAFAGKGNTCITVLQLVMQHTSYQEMLKQLGMEWVSSIGYAFSEPPRVYMQALLLSTRN